MLAEKTNCSSNLVCSSLLHDYGHFILENPDDLISQIINLDGKHEDVGYDVSKKNFLQKKYSGANQISCLWQKNT